MAEFKEVYNQLKLARGPIQWVGIHDSRVPVEVTDAVTYHGFQEIQEPWEFLAYGKNPKPMALRQGKAIVSRVSWLMTDQHYAVTDCLNANPDPLGGGCVLLALGKNSRMELVLGDSMMRWGQGGHDESDYTWLQGVAMPLPGFGLSCIVSKVMDTPLFRDDVPGLSHHDVYIQGLNAQTTAALAHSGL